MAQGGAKPKLVDLNKTGGSSYVDRKTAEKIKRRPKMEKFPFKCPAGVPKEVRKQFNYFEKLLAPRGNWTEGDIDGIMALCESKVAVAKLRKEVDEEGRTYWATTGQGNRVMKTNPACALLDKEIRRFDNYLYEYGLTPLGRIKLGISPDGGGPLDEIEDKDDAAKYF